MNLKIFSWIFGFSLSWAPLAMTNTQALPKNVRAAAFVFGRGSDIKTQFNSSGELESLVRPLNRSLSIEDLVQAEPDLLFLRDMTNMLSGTDLGSKLIAADIYSDISVTESRYVSALMYGITNRFSLGVIVPYVERKVNIDFNVSVRNNAEKAAKIVGNLPGFKDAYEKLASTNLSTESFSRGIFDSNGYQRPESFTVKGLGEIEIEARYSFYESGRFKFASRSNLKLPTSTYQPSINNLFDQHLGDNVVAIKTGFLTDVSLIPNLLTLHSALFGTIRLPRNQWKAVPKSADQPLPNLNDPDQIESVVLYPGSQFDADIALSLDLWKGVLSFNSSYLYSVRSPDRYVGRRSLYYAWLTRDRFTQSHGIETAMELSTIPLFFKGKWPVPIRTWVSWYQPFHGINSINAPYGSVNAVLLF